MSNYKYSVDLISGLRPKNNADFPLVRAHDVQSRDDGTRLDAELEMLRAGGGATIYEGTVTVPGDTPGDLGVALSLTQGATYIVELNGKSYKCVHGVSSVGSYPYLGNPKLLHSENTDTGEPFCLMLAPHTTYLETDVAGNYTLKIKEAASGGIAELAEQVATNTSAIEYLDQRVEGNEESIRDLYDKLQSGGNANFIFADSEEELPDPSTVPENTVAFVPSKGESGGGGDLPPATAADNGKFVQVVNGAYGLVALQDVSKEGA